MDKNDYYSFLNIQNSYPNMDDSLNVDSQDLKNESIKQLHRPPSPPGDQPDWIINYAFQPWNPRNPWFWWDPHVPCGTLNPCGPKHPDHDDHHPDHRPGHHPDRRPDQHPSHRPDQHSDHRHHDYN